MKKRLLIGLVAIGAVLSLAYLYILPIDLSDRSPEQPIAFSHLQHAGQNGIPCLYCHRYADRSPVAGIPSVAACRECHLYIAQDSPEVKKLIAYWDGRQVPPWVKVHILPDHVYFPHMMHVRARVACGSCHGEVAEMKRIERQASLRMGWCLDCHRQKGASIDCWACHI